ncbi:MAG TPA: protein-glutamate O-methyltransferase CheR [Vicinamibacterales bacterium]|nr:protein-glutamate O-methyltransferase CheR [Vicinamibacterales bacterium]
MSFQSDNLGLSSAAMPLLRELVQERLGVAYEVSRLDVLRDRLAPLVVERGFQSFLDYYYLLKYDPASSSEWSRVMDVLSVPETYFWREIDQLRAVVDLLLPALVRSFGTAPLRIWSVPCATGEEPLTLAMLLEERGWFDRAPIEIHAGDASPAVVERARQGRYRDRSFRALPPHVKERHFVRDGDTWMVDPALHGRVRSWNVLNLVDDQEAAAMAGAPIVFCRNVFIYFSEAGVRRVVDRFARLMPAPGYLCVGASESLLKVTTCFELEEVGGAFVYVKKK